jgi:hypothetical protein
MNIVDRIIGEINEARAENRGHTIGIYLGYREWMMLVKSYEYLIQNAEVVSYHNTKFCGVPVYRVCNLNHFKVA